MAKNQIRTFFKKIYEKLKKARFKLNKKAQKSALFRGSFALEEKSPKGSALCTLRLSALLTTLGLTN